MKSVPPVCTVLNLKGGVGKTHVCWLLSGVCQERGERCLVVDLDQQANLTQSFLPEHRDPNGVELIFEPTADVEPASLVRRTAFEGIDVVPVTGHFARYDLSRPEQWERTRLHAALGEVLAEIATGYDLVLLDCPPRISLASYAALCASDFAIVPLEAADWGARGTATVRAVIERVRQYDNPDLALLGYVVSKFKTRRTFQRAYLEQIAETFGPLLFETIVPDSAVFERSVDERVPVVIHSPRSHAATIARELHDELRHRIAAASKGESRVGRCRRPVGPRSDARPVTRR